ncbi:hypothetical protein J6P92_00025 [bacterium]|nr:hypothetical protein [bacterium]
MAVEGVNNSNNNAGLYALGAGVLGAGAGAGVAYMTKPFLKDGAPTDSFVKKMSEKFLENNDTEVKSIRDKYDKLSSSLAEVKDKDCLNRYIKDKKLNIPDEVLKSIKEATNIEEARTYVSNCLDVDLESELGDIVKKFDAEKTYKNFVNNENQMDKATKEIVKKSIKSIQGKYALIYGSIAAGVLGIGTYLATMGGKSSAPEQKVDAQA